MRRSGETVRTVEYSQYAQAESCFISLLSEVERHSGGWAELLEGERVVVRTGDERIPQDAEAEDASVGQDSILT